MGEKIITVFGSSRPQSGDGDYGEARELGKALAGRGFAVCTGGYGGTMEAASRGAKQAGGKTYGITAEFFGRGVNQWVDVEIRKKTWAERLFALVEMGDGFVVCKGGTGTLVELAVVWEMLNKGVMAAKPVVVLGAFWTPVVERVREVEREHRAPTEVPKWGEGKAKLVHSAASAEEAAEFLEEKLKSVRVEKQKSER